MRDNDKNKNLDKVEPIPHKRLYFSQSKPLKKRHQPSESTPPTDHQHPPIPSYSPIAGDDTIAYFKDQSLQSQKKKWMKLKPTQTIDLHGMTLDEANVHIHESLQHAYQAHHRIILFIHGKALTQSAAPLKSMLAATLEQHPHVLAYWSAPNHLGGTGALFCIIKNNKDSL